MVININALKKKRARTYHRHTRLGLQAVHFMGQSPILLGFYRELICISYVLWNAKECPSLNPSIHLKLTPLPALFPAFPHHWLGHTGTVIFINEQSLFRAELPRYGGFLLCLLKSAAQARVCQAETLISTDREPSLSYRETSELGRFWAPGSIYIPMPPWQNGIARLR